MKTGDFSLLIRKGFYPFIFRPTVSGLAVAFLNILVTLLVSLMAWAAAATHPLIGLYQGIYPGYGLHLPGILLGLIWSGIYGFVFGFLVAWIYGLQVRRRLQASALPVFHIDSSQKIHILQAGKGARPFTLVFVANPVIAHPRLNRYEPDPILKDSRLFFRTVIRVLRSLANNPLWRQPAIANRMRLIAIFDPSRNVLQDAYALCESISEFDHILAPRPETSIILDYVTQTADADRRIEYADVIFVVSASETLTRSSARFSVDAAEGRPFKFSFEAADGPLTQKMHAFEAAVPGVVALSAWDDRLKTPLHELAHALSSLENGAIVDEYLDRYADNTEHQLQFVINRKHRLHSTDAIPDVFATYQGPDSEAVLYYSDRHRSDKPEGWTSYVPEKATVGSSCIMDIAYFDYHYDPLIFDFLYDRLMVKMNRPGH